MQLNLTNLTIQIQKFQPPCPLYHTHRRAADMETSWLARVRTKATSSRESEPLVWSVPLCALDQSPWPGCASVQETAVSGQETLRLSVAVLQREVPLLILSYKRFWYTPVKMRSIYRKLDIWHPLSILMSPANFRFHCPPFPSSRRINLSSCNPVRTSTHFPKLYLSPSWALTAI